MARDPSLDTLLLLDGTTYVLDPDGAYWARIDVKRAPVSEEPHGLDYSLTFHGPASGDSRDTRLVGFDNAHPIRTRAGPGGRRKTWTTGTGSARSGLTTMRTRLPSWRISGKTRCWPKEG